MSEETSLRLKATGPAAASLTPESLEALVEASLLQLFGVIGGAVPYTFEAEGGTAGALTVHPRDETKVRQALALVSSNQGKPLRIEVE